MFYFNFRSGRFRNRLQPQIPLALGRGLQFPLAVHVERAFLGFRSKFRQGGVVVRNVMCEDDKFRTCKFRRSFRLRYRKLHANSAPSIPAVVVAGTSGN